MEQLSVYRNPDGTIGIRRHVLVLGLNAFCETAARSVGNLVAGTTILVHPHGRNEIGVNRDRFERTLRGVVQNGNVHSAVVIGYERETTDRIVREIAQASGKRVEAVVLLDRGGSWAAALEGARKAAALVAEASECERVESRWDRVRVAVKCGGSDGSSTLAAIPAVGRCADWLVERGATVVFSETTEIIGAEHLLAKRAKTPAVAKRIVRAAADNLEMARRAGVDLLGTNPVPDNIAGGITTIEEKALGAIVKAGTHPIEDVVGYGEAPAGTGLYFMDSPSGAHEVMSGFAVAGCHVTLFATGTCNPAGNLLMPVIKVSGNREWVRRMADHVDVDVSDVVDEGTPLDDGAKRVWDKLVRVLRGGLTRSEICRHTEFSVVPTGL